MPAKQHPSTPFSELLRAAMAAVQDGNLFASKISMTLELARRIATAAREEVGPALWVVGVAPGESRCPRTDLKAACSMSAVLIAVQQLCCSLLIIRWT